MESVERWAAILDELEAAALAAGTVAPSSSGLDWSAPATFGPIPFGLIGRARYVRELQVEAENRLRASLTSARAQADLLGAVNAAAGRTGSAKRSAYLDVSA
ncbi:hypothetical protein BJ994_000287 [Arthrobacter pigmenti]|uniref:Uncharacterized protein n=1 Tax=Arthrobacter pigmenti TaxID=271432 RepID=A0A846RSC0_9MICC|nr:hypothetical protein [Arthrobacter pigmenti]NJC21211.1 hypothetical protein [Arthrobacter pigmenti]